MNRRRRRSAAAAAGRASLACTVCRQRKVKCSGDWPSCAACLRRSDRCEYAGLNGSTTNPSSRGDEETASAPPETFGDVTSGLNQTSENLPPQDILAKATETFLLLYGEFPFWFLQRHVFREDLAEGLVPSCLLFCILSVVARFVEPCYELYGGTIEASIHFASLAREHTLRMHDEISLLNVHCNLVLGLYELGHGDEHRAWLRLGTASRICQILGLPFENNYFGDDIIAAEIKRRTFWSCYAMERLLVNGHDRPLHIPNYKISTSLPTSSADFVLGRVGHSTTLSTDPSQTDTLQAFTIRITDLLSRIVQWGGAGIGGRHDDPRSPWLEDMPYARLQKELQQWHSSLPSYLALNDVNIRAHVEVREDKLFGLMHLFYLTAGLRLYRKYLPFIPPQAYDPTFDGPADGPELIPGPDAPGFWGETARMGVQFAVAIAEGFMQISEHGHDPWDTPLSGVALIESSMMLVFAVHTNWRSCEDFAGVPAKNMLARNLRLLLNMQENWPVAAFRVKYLRLFYERVSLSQNPIISPDDPYQPPLWTVKEAMLHFNRSDQAKEGLPSYLPKRQHDLFQLLDETSIE